MLFLEDDGIACMYLLLKDAFLICEFAQGSQRCIYNLKYPFLVELIIKYTKYLRYF